MKAGHWIPCLMIASVLARGEVLFPTAGQGRSSCGFHANIPALTLATGVDLAAEPRMAASIYGLQRGDRSFQTSFSKERFYELFSIPCELVEIDHPMAPESDLTDAVANLVKERIDPALEDGRMFSLRVTGVFGGPHNVLLMAKNGDTYLVHDPSPGAIRRMDRTRLARWMLVRTTATRNAARPRYLTNFLKVELQERHASPWLPAGRLHEALELSLTASGAGALLREFAENPEAPQGAGLDERIARYSKIDFAAMPPPAPGDFHRNAVNPELEIQDLAGVLQLAKFMLAVWDSGKRDHLPVLFLDGRPHAFVAYRPSADQTEDERTLGFHDGRQLVRFTAAQALDAFKKDGCHYGTVVLPRIAADGGE